METNAPPSVILGLTTSLKEKGQYIFPLVNTTSGPVHPIRKLIPVQDIVVKIKIPGKTYQDSKILRCQGDCTVKKSGDGFEVNISKLQNYFSMHFTMG